MQKLNYNISKIRLKFYNISKIRLRFCLHKNSIHNYIIISIYLFILQVFSFDFVVKFDPNMFLHAFV